MTDQTAARRTKEAMPGQEQVALPASIVDSSDDAIMAKPPEGIITCWNRGAENIYGYAVEEIPGQPISLLTHPDRPNKMTEFLEILHGAGATFRVFRLEMTE